MPFTRSDLKTLSEDIAVDTASIVMIDPCHLFTREEWTSVIRMPGKDHNKNIAKAIKKKFISDSPVRPNELVHVVGTGGDGSYKVEIAKNGDIVIKTVYGPTNDQEKSNDAYAN